MNKNDYIEKLTDKVRKDKEDTMRKLATVRQIKAILPIEKADRVEIVVVDGWKCVVKKGEFRERDLIIYVEIDSLVPAIEEFSYLSAYCKEKPMTHYPTGYLIKTAKLRGQISQGLILNMNILPEGVYNIGDDVTDILGIELYEPEIDANCPNGNFPYFLRKSDQERIQNLEWYSLGGTYEVTEKLDGTSCTLYYYNGKVGVCSRNLEINADLSDNHYTRIFNRYKEILKKLGENLAIQGEIIGEGIQGNPYKLKGIHFYVYNIWDIDKQEYLVPSQRIEKLYRTGSLMEDFLHVPIVFPTYDLIGSTDALILMADGKSLINKNIDREGIVFKHWDRQFSFKVISNKYLLRRG